MKTIGLGTILLLALALLLAMSPVPAAAAAPGNTFPGAALYINNQTQTIDANASLWYRFDYAGDRSAITVTLVNGTNSGLHFNVFTPDEIGSWWDARPIGRGTALTLNCDTGKPDENGQCLADDLTWGGNFNAPGTYYVQVVNPNSTTLTFQMTIQGTGVTLGQQATASTPPPASQPQAPSSKPPTASNTTANNTFPAGAVAIDNQVHTIPANGSLWYRFDYAVNHSQVTIMLLNGPNSGVGFQVFTPGQIGDWWSEAPIGQGTTQSVNCANGAPQQGGACQSTAPIWVGRFNANGVYDVRVFNNNPTPVTLQLTIQGDGVVPGQ